MTDLRVAPFLERFGFSLSAYDVEKITCALLADMHLSLDVKGGGDELMLPTHRTLPAMIETGKTAVVIDAGGTNFRSCLVSFDATGKPMIEGVRKKAMPGTCPKEAFFDEIAANLDYIKDASDTIGFCFSYGMEMLENGDAKILELSKEMKGKGIVGSLAGASLSEALVRRGWKKKARIVVVNDAAAALLAGFAGKAEGKSYDSYAAFILGTGINSAYIEYEKIGKLSGIKRLENQIVVCESGSFSDLPKSVFDTELDAASTTKGMYTLEKMCGGVYLAQLASLMLDRACVSGLVSEKAAKRLDSSGRLSLSDIDGFLHTRSADNALLAGVSFAAMPSDFDALYSVFDALIERATRIAAAAASAAVIKTGKGKDPSRPVCLLCNGTTFYKTHDFEKRFRSYVYDALTEKRGIYFDAVSVQDDIAIGTAASALGTESV
ncbi:hexokinase [Treponema socranskii]|uniref:hexokinase n=1 Tax=Treponema socranskii TaxID=53419 RepID=UPI003D932A98